MTFEIPRGNYGDAGPCWVPRFIDPGDPYKVSSTGPGTPIKPVIICKCGAVCHISLHHVYADGLVLASFFHDSAAHPDIGYPGGGCGWHVYLKLRDYNHGEFPPHNGS